MKTGFAARFIFYSSFILFRFVEVFRMKDTKRAVLEKVQQHNPLASRKDEAQARDESGLISTHIEPERALLAQLLMDEESSTRTSQNVSAESHVDDESSLEELAGLCEAANAVVVGNVSQKRDKPHPATMFGKGKVEEIQEICERERVDVMVVDRELSPAQGRNLENILKVRVIDRTELILDIFARRAQTRQAKLQVELAQLRYQLPRLKRMWTHLSRIGGGIGLRGPGETQLETDRRLAGERVALLEKQLGEIRKHNQVASALRSDYETGALIGYTNVGKSALLNALSRPTGSGVLVADQLFATLGASTRKVQLGGGRDVLMSDTVGFVRRLPHFLVESFHSTLAEVRDADFLLLTGNAADVELDDKLQSVNRVLKELEVAQTPQILVLNQCDLIDDEARETLRFRHPDAVFTSALSGEGLDDLRERIKQTLEANDEEVALSLDASAPETGKMLADLAHHGRILAEDWSSGGNGQTPRVHVRARLAPRWREQLGIAKNKVLRAA